LQYLSNAVTADGPPLASGKRRVFTDLGHADT
jgi:hypothetical protein